LLSNQAIYLQKCSCNSSWCQKCFRHRTVPSIRKKLSLFDWRRTREIVLSVSPLYAKKSGIDKTDQAALYEHIKERSAISQFIHNLKRVHGIKLDRFAWVMEWYRSGYWHYHLFVQVEKAGAAGMIGKERCGELWPYGVVWETYIKSEIHWKAKIGYFNKNGYFEKKKGHQTRLPEWAKQYTSTIRRRGGSIEKDVEKQTRNEKPNSERNKRREKAMVIMEKNEKFYHQNGHFGDDDPGRNTYEAIISKCGSLTEVVVERDGFPIYGFSVRIEYAFFIKQFRGEYVKGKGYLIKVDDFGLQMLNQFISQNERSRKR
jgi:hypothetical protein